MQIVRLADAQALTAHVADWLVVRALAAQDRFTIALSGGSTPKALFELLATSPYRDRLPWGRTHVFWGDERFVPEDSPDNNAHVARMTLLDHVPIPPAQIHPMPCSGDIAQAARDYQASLTTHYSREALDMEQPLFDVNLLGLGENGHTASLFPGTPALEEALAWVTPVTEGVPQPRLTLTYPALACSRAVAFLVSGANKSDVVRRVLGGDRSQPAARVTSAGDLFWFLDEAAAGGLPA